MQADIYSFGIFVIELITRDDPFPEFHNLFNNKARWKLTHGYAPLSLSRIQHPQATHFIERCLLPEDARPTAVELLNDDFLNIGEEDDIEVKLGAMPVYVDEDDIDDQSNDASEEFHRKGLCYSFDSFHSEIIQTSSSHQHRFDSKDSDDLYNFNGIGNNNGIGNGIGPDKLSYDLNES